MKLTYFDFDGGRAEAARIALFSGNIDFEDDRISFQTFVKNYKSYPYKAVPVLTIDGEIISQSVAITQYAGRLSGYYPEDPIEQLRCDEILNVIENATQIFGPSVKSKDPEQIKVMREELLNGYLKNFIIGLDQTISKRKDGYFADSRITIADFAMYAFVNWMNSGMLDHIPKTIVSDLGPKLAEYHKKISGAKEIKGYYEMRKKA